MFRNKKIRMAVAAVSAAMSMLINIIAPIAAPYGISNVEDVRSKALSNYLSANKVIATVSSKAPVIDENYKITEDSIAFDYSTVTVKEPVSYTTVKRLNVSLAPGDTAVVREGAEGERIVTYKIRYENGKEVSREAVASIVTKEPVIKVVEYAAQSDWASGASSDASVDVSKLNYSYYIDCEATAYDLSAEENGGYAGQSATGVPLDKGVIAVDPRVIPLGTRVYIEAVDGSWTYGYAVAADTGGAIKGKRVDLCYRTQYECIQFGRRPCRVYILN